MEKMYTIKEVSDMFGVHYNTVRNWIRSGEIKCVKIAETIRIPDSEINRLMNRND